jgi:hypothetical protein
MVCLVSASADAGDNLIVSCVSPSLSPGTVGTLVDAAVRGTADPVALKPPLCIRIGAKGSLRFSFSPHVLGRRVRALFIFDVMSISRSTPINHKQQSWGRLERSYSNCSSRACAIFLHCQSEERGVYAVSASYRNLARPWVPFGRNSSGH